MKPILHVIFHDHKPEQIQSVAAGFKNIFADDYQLVFTTDQIDVVADNSTVINFNLGAIEQLDGIIEYFKQYAEFHKKEQEGILND